MTQAEYSRYGSRPKDKAWPSLNYVIVFMKHFWSDLEVIMKL